VRSRPRHRTTRSFRAVLSCCGGSVARTLNFTADLIRRHLEAIGSRWRKPAPGRQALPALAHLRHNITYAELAAGFGIGVATAYRYVCEVVDLLGELAPDLREAVRVASGKAYVILDGPLAPIDRLRGEDDRRYYSGKHHRDAVNVQFLTDPHGRLI
jgi:hypothetical protein